MFGKSPEDDLFAPSGKTAVKVGGVGGWGLEVVSLWMCMHTHAHAHTT